MAERRHSLQMRIDFLGAEKVDIQLSRQWRPTIAVQVPDGQKLR